MSDFIGDESLDYEEGEDDNAIVDASPDFVEDDGEEEVKEEVKQEKKPVKVSPPEPPKAEQPTPQVTAEPIDAKLVKRYQDIRQSLNLLEGESKVLDSVAAGLAQALHNDFKELEKKNAELEDTMFYSTPEGKQAAELIRLSGGELTKKGAMNLVQMGNKQMHLEGAKASKRGEAKPVLDAHYKRVANIFKMKESDMLSELKDLSTGKNVHTLTEDGGRGFEVVIDNV